MLAASSTLDPNVRTRFMKLALSFGATPSLADSWSNTFVARYTEPQRYYHTLSHVEAMLECLEARRAELTDAVAVELAVYFHDWIYEPQGVANEAESVQAFRRFADEVGLAEHRKERVARLIEATVTHQINQDARPEEKSDLALFLDFDLEVLGREWEAYEVYARQIRNEYACFEEQEYRSGRAKVLRRFSERERLYFSEGFHLEKEKTARSNIRREIELLEDDDSTHLDADISK